MSYCLITGGSGYFGSILCKSLLKKGNKVRIFDLNDSIDRDSSVEYIHGDICDPKKVEQACDDCDIIFHCVAQVPLAKSKKLFESVNVGGTKNLLAAAKKFKAKKIIYVSSSAIYGIPFTNPVMEEHIPIPRETYGKAKLEGEKLCLNEIHNGLDITIVRPRTILGHGRLGIFHILFNWISEGYNIPVLGKGDNQYQFIHAEDLAEACILSSEQEGSNIYNCGATEFCSMRETLESLCLHANTGSKVKSLPKLPATLMMKVTSRLGLTPLGAYHSLMYGRSFYFDTTKLQDLSWTAKYSNTDMMCESYDWFLKKANQEKEGELSAHQKSLNEKSLWMLKKLL
jgi:nucleoside-diphosphate-sugar epimerase